MYDFFMSLKQADGSFLVCHHGEVDVRCVRLLVVSSMSLTDKATYVEGCIVSWLLPLCSIC